MPVAMIAETASLAARTVGKSASMVRTLAGIGSSRTVISRGDAEHPLAADEQPDEVGSPGLALAASRAGRRVASGSTTSSSTT